MQRQISAKVVLLIFGVFTLLLTASFYIFAWTEPAGVPPTLNTPAPINVGSVPQAKQGFFSVGSSVSPVSILHIYSTSTRTWGTDLSLDSTNYIGGRRWSLISSGTGASEGTGKFLIKDNAANAVRMTVDTAGQVGIGNVTPAGTLHVYGGSNLNKILAEADASAGNSWSFIATKVNKTSGAGGFKIINSSGSDRASISMYPNASNPELSIQNSATGGYISLSTGGAARLSVLNNGNVGIGTTNPGVKLDVNGDIRANKLTINTIDPVYNIEGKDYATYVSDFSGGVRMETSGLIKSGLGRIIDFQNLEKGSDLWLFWQASNKDIDDLVVILTPGFDGKVSYKKEGNKLIIVGDQSGEISYRLTLPRKDYQEWSNEVAK